MTNAPLAERMRPKTLAEYVGQGHLVGEGKVLWNVIKSGSVPSFILWGPPGTGKTTLAGIIANELDIPFLSLSAVSSGVKDVRDSIEKAQKSKFFNKNKTILFIDEIHRFSKSQQDSLLNAVEKGIVTLVGATTENPSFEVNSALLSRCQVYVLEHLDKSQMIDLVDRALAQDEVLAKLPVKVSSYDTMIKYSGGDARRLLNILELVVMQYHNQEEIIIDDDTVASVVKQNPLLYDKTGEMHYDLISAFIKSVRGSDPNAALYYLARMIEGGEDPLFLCRRMVILAAEDVGLANPNALLMANSCFQSVHQIGMPEGRIVMGQTAIYLAMSPKSNSAYVAIDAALDAVRKGAVYPVPLALRNAPTKLMKELNYGKEYLYAHAYYGNFIETNLLPDEMKGTKFYNPANNKQEHSFLDRLKSLWSNIYKY
jgi:putative ATPase